MSIDVPETKMWLEPPPSVESAREELALVLAELAVKRQSRREVVTEILELESDRRYLRDFIALHLGDE